MEKTKTDSLKIIMAVFIFFCHIYPSLNFFGCFFVSWFFFLSGFGSNFSSKAWHERILSLIPLYCVMVCCYSVFAGRFYWDIPSAWFLLIYSIQHIFYGISKSIKTTVILNLILTYFFVYFGFNFPWYASMFCFPLGLIYSRSKKEHRLSTLDLLGLAVLSVVILLFSGMYKIPLQPLACISFIIATKPLIKYLPKANKTLTDLLFPFYLGHILLIELFGLRSTFGFENHLPAIISIPLAFISSVIFAYLVNLFLQNNKKKCEIR